MSMQANLLSFLNILLRYHYGCVIYGWDPVCEMDESWIQRMGVDQSPGGRNQPFYNVLGDDGSQRYAAHSKLNFWLKLVASDIVMLCSFKIFHPVFRITCKWRHLYDVSPFLQIKAIT